MKYHWWRLASTKRPGQSVVLEGIEDEGKLRVSASQWGKKYGGKLSVKKLGEGKYEVVLKEAPARKPKSVVGRPPGRWVALRELGVGGVMKVAIEKDGTPAGAKAVAAVAKAVEREEERVRGKRFAVDWRKFGVVVVRRVR